MFNQHYLWIVLIIFSIADLYVTQSVHCLTLIAKFIVPTAKQCRTPYVIRTAIIRPDADLENSGEKCNK